MRQLVQNQTKIIEQIANLINSKKVPLEDIADESDENIRIVLKPKNRNIDASKLMELCYKLSDLSTRFSCNFNVLENGIIPKQLGLKDILLHFSKIYIILKRLIWSNDYRIYLKSLNILVRNFFLPLKSKLKIKTRLKLFKKK